MNIEKGSIMRGAHALARPRSQGFNISPASGSSYFRFKFALFLTVSSDRSASFFVWILSYQFISKRILFASHKKVYPGLKGLVWYESLSSEHENRRRHSMLAKEKHHKQSLSQFLDNGLQFFSLDKLETTLGSHSSCFHVCLVQFLFHNLQKGE